MYSNAMGISCVTLGIVANRCTQWVLKRTHDKFSKIRSPCLFCFVLSTSLGLPYEIKGLSVDSYKDCSASGHLHTWSLWPCPHVCVYSTIAAGAPCSPSHLPFQLDRKTESLKSFAL